MIRQFFLLCVLFVVGALTYYGLNTVQQKAPDTARGNSVFIYVYFHDNVYPVRRPLAAERDPLFVAMQELMTGVTTKEAQRGLVSQIPLGLTVHTVEVHDDVAHVFFGPELLKISGGAAQIEGILAQVVYTATQFPHIQSVVLRIAGKPQRALALGGEGYIIDGPITKDYFKRR